MDRRFTPLIVLLWVGFSPCAWSQLRYWTNANQSSVSGGLQAGELTAQGENGIAIALRRGSGSTQTENEVKVVCSSNAGRTFTEVSISNSTMTNTWYPLIASTVGSVISIYGYDSSGTRKVLIARSTKIGNPFTLTSVSNPDFAGMFKYLASYPELVSDGASKYYVAYHDLSWLRSLFVSTDDGMSFRQLQVPSTIPGPLWAEWAASSGNLWLVFPSAGRDSMHVYRSGDDGSTFELVAGLLMSPGSVNMSWKSFACCALGDRLAVAWVEEKSGMYSLKTASITGKKAGPINTITLSSTLISEPMVKMTSNRIFAKLANQIFLSTDSGVTWSRGADAKVEVSAPTSVSDYVPVNDTTLHLCLTPALYGDPYIRYANWQWTDFPVPSVDSVVANKSFVDMSVVTSYVQTPSYRRQLSSSSTMSPVLFDTVTGSATMVTMRGRFPANATQYYFRVRGEDGNYVTSWSRTGSFRYGIVITDAPTLVSPLNGTVSSSTFDLALLRWNSLLGATNYDMHLSRNGDFSDTVTSQSYLVAGANPFMVAYPPTYGTFYWRVRASHLLTGSYGPWSAAWHYTWSEVTNASVVTSALPKEYALSQNFPNPFNPSTRMTVALPYHSRVKISVFNMLGQIVAQLVDCEMPAGFQSVDWNPAVASGTYFLHFEAQAVGDESKHYRDVRKVILLK